MSNTPAAEGNRLSPLKVTFAGYMVSSPFTSSRWLDPVRAAALHEAVFGYRHFEEDDDDPIGEILEVAARFERWLAGTDEDSP